MFRSSLNFDKLLGTFLSLISDEQDVRLSNYILNFFIDKATNPYQLEPDWVAVLQICDLIRQGDVQ